MLTHTDFESNYENHWCPGCGNFGILAAMKEALAALDIPPHRILIVSGIGQAAKTPHFIKCNFFHSLHGRALRLAENERVAGFVYIGTAKEKSEERERPALADIVADWRP